MLKFLRWFFGISWLIAGLSFATGSTVAGGILIALAGLLILPPIFPYLTEKAGKMLGRGPKVITVLLLFFSGISLFTSAEDTKAAEKKQQEKLAFERLPQATKDSITHAKAHRDSLVAMLRADSITAVTRLAETSARKEKIEAQFSAYDGSHRGVEQAIKQRMNDPDSYEHVSTRFIDKGDYIAIMTQFRGKNAFGGKVLNSAVGKVDFSGNVLALQIL